MDQYDRRVKLPMRMKNQDFEDPATPGLYHISQDRSEQQNLATEYSERVREMKRIHAKLDQGSNETTGA